MAKALTNDARNYDARGKPKSRKKKKSPSTKNRTAKHSFNLSSHMTAPPASPRREGQHGSRCVISVQTGTQDGCALAEVTLAWGWESVPAILGGPELGPQGGDSVVGVRGRGKDRRCAGRAPGILASPVPPGSEGLRGHSVWTSGAAVPLHHPRLKPLPKLLL